MFTWNLVDLQYCNDYITILSATNMPISGEKCDSSWNRHIPAYFMWDSFSCISFFQIPMQHYACTSAMYWFLIAAFSENRALWLIGAASNQIKTRWELLESRNYWKSVNWQSLGPLLNNTDKKPTLSIQQDQSYQATNTMAPQFQSSFRQKRGSCLQPWH